MNNTFQSFLYVGPKKLIISINDEFTFKEYFKKEKLIDNFSDEIMLKNISKFLDENIYFIEKNLNNFIKKIFLIIDYQDFLTIEISIKKKNYNQLLIKKNLKHPLKEAKEECKKTFDEKKIIHTIIENYNIDNKDYSYLPKNIKCDNFSLDIKFICIKISFLQKLQQIFKKYQISINRVICAGYVRNFFPQNDHNIIKNSKEIINGCNENEVQFTIKSQGNVGFFERFFKLFS